jgi:hypothetical protein
MTTLKKSICTDCIKNDVCIFKATVQSAEVLQNELYHNIKIEETTNYSIVAKRENFKPYYDLQSNGIFFNTECHRKVTKMDRFEDM